MVERVFEPFYTTKNEGQGTGLGLAAVFGTVQQHGGSVVVRSELGEGTRFAIRLPAVALERPRPQPPIDLVPGEGVILVVDDEVPVLTTVKMTLKSLGYTVMTAGDGLEALEIFRREHHQIRMVLLDMAMPKMNGEDCFNELRAIDTDVRVIASSGFFVPEVLEAMLRRGLNGYLQKPYHHTELSQAIRKGIRDKA